MNRRMKRAIRLASIGWASVGGNSNRGWYVVPHRSSQLEWYQLDHYNRWHRRYEWNSKSPTIG